MQNQKLSPSKSRRITMILIATSVFSIQALTGCGKGSSSSHPYNYPQDGSFTNTQLQYRALVKPLWEEKGPEGAVWTIHAFNTIEKSAPALIKGSQDIKSFCPNFFTMSTDEKISFWVYLLSAMTHFESNHNPTLRFHEKSMGKDRVTGRPVYSEGLLQLSYQDSTSYEECAAIDWKKDRNLKPNDKKKTIFNPFLNLTCGIGILDHQVERRDTISRRDKIYWSVLRTKKNGKVHRIRALTRKLPFCSN